MEKKIIVANWKANKTREEAKAWVDVFSAAAFPSKPIQVVICPPVVHLFEVYRQLKTASFPFPVTVGVQNLSPYPGGTYTGEVTASMVRGVATHVILGHSERRQWFSETPQQVALAVDQALEHQITPIVSVDRTNWRLQLAQFDDQTIRQILLMYEPPEAISEQIGPIGRGQTADLTDIEDMIGLLSKAYGNTRVLYGGSVKSANVKPFLESALVSGVVVGTASMEVHEFIRLISQV